jgi:hypothetical protein
MGAAAVAQGCLHTMVNNASPWRWKGATLSTFLSACKALGVDLEPESLTAEVKAATTSRAKMAATTGKLVRSALRDAVFAAAAGVAWSEGIGEEEDDSC